jgi:surface protein
MEGMFQNCVSMITLDLSNFMTGNVNYMAKMFFNCSSLKTLNIENFNSENVNDFNDIFKGLNSQCEIITKDQNLAKLLENSCLIF